MIFQLGIYFNSTAIRLNVIIFLNQSSDLLQYDENSDTGKIADSNWLGLGRVMFRHI